MNGSKLYIRRRQQRKIWRCEEADWFDWRSDRIIYGFFYETHCKIIGVNKDSKFRLQWRIYNFLQIKSCKNRPVVGQSTTDFDFNCFQGQEVTIVHWRLFFSGSDCGLRAEIVWACLAHLKSQTLSIQSWDTNHDAGLFYFKISVLVHFGCM